MLLIRRIRDLLYDQGFTISGASQPVDARPSCDDQAGDNAVVPPGDEPNRRQPAIGVETAGADPVVLEPLASTCPATTCNELPVRSALLKGRACRWRPV